MLSPFVNNRFVGSGGQKPRKKQTSCFPLISHRKYHAVRAIHAIDIVSGCSSSRPVKMRAAHKGQIGGGQRPKSKNCFIDDEAGHSTSKEVEECSRLQCSSSSSMNDL